MVQTDSLIWLGLLIAFLVVEGATVAMVSLWFAAGSLAALIASMLGAPGWVQIALFVAVSVALLLALRPWARRYADAKKTPTNVDAVIGTQGYVTAAVDNLAAQGQVKLGGMTWTARSSSGDPIPEGTRIRVDRIEGVKVFVTPVPNTTPQNQQEETV